MYIIGIYKYMSICIHVHTNKNAHILLIQRSRCWHALVDPLMGLRLNASQVSDSCKRLINAPRILEVFLGRPSFQTCLPHLCPSREPFQSPACPKSSPQHVLASDELDGSMQPENDGLMNQFWRHTSWLCKVPVRAFLREH